LTDCELWIDCSNMQSRRFQRASLTCFKGYASAFTRAVFSQSVQRNEWQEIGEKA